MLPTKGSHLLRSGKGKRRPVVGGGRARERNQKHTQQDDRETNEKRNQYRDVHGAVTIHRRPIPPAPGPSHCVIAVGRGAARQRGGARKRSPPRMARARYKGGATTIHTRQKPPPLPHGKKRKATGITPPPATEATCCGSGRDEADRPPEKGNKHTHTHAGNGAQWRGQTNRRRRDSAPPSSSVHDPPLRTSASPHCVFQQRAVAPREGRSAIAAHPLPSAGAIKQEALERHLCPRMLSPLPHRQEEGDSNRDIHALKTKRTAWRGPAGR